MRATISFETDVEQVDEIMLAVTKHQTDEIRAVAHILETSQPHQLSSVLAKSLDKLYAITHQLEQYNNMMATFNSAKYETVLPQEATKSVANIGAAVANLNKFGDFIDRLNAQGSAEEGAANVEPATEG